MSQMNPVDVFTPGFIKDVLLRSFPKVVAITGNEVHFFPPSDCLSAWKNVAPTE
jgi:hypothetical protein